MSFIRIASRSIIITLLVDFLLKLKGLVLIPILTKTIGVLDYGVWALVGTAVSVAAVASGLGLDSAMIRFLPTKTDKERTREFWTVLLLWTGASGTLCLFFFLASSAVSIHFLGGAHNTFLVKLGGLTLVTSTLSQAFKRYFRVTLQIRIYSILTVVESFAATISTAAAVLMGYGVAGALVAGLLTDALVAVIGAFLALRQIGFAFPSRACASQYLAFGLPLVPTAFFVWISNAADRFIVDVYAGPEQVGLYSVIYSLGYMGVLFIFNPIYTVIPQVLSQLWDRGDFSELKRLIHLCLKFSLLASMALGVWLLLKGGEFLSLLTTKAYAEQAGLLFLIYCGYTFFMVSGMAEQILSLAQKTRWFPSIFGFCAALNLALNFVLVPVYGIWGAAWATTLAFLGQMVLTLSLSARFFRIELPTREILLGLVALLPGLGILCYMPVQGLPALGGASILAFISYFLVLRLTKVIAPSEIRATLEILGVKSCI